MRKSISRLGIKHIIITFYHIMSSTIYVDNGDTECRVLSFLGKILIYLLHT